MVSPSDIPPPSIGFLIWHLSMKWRAGLDRELAPLGLTAARYAVLASLHGLEEGGSRPSQRELADFSGLETMYVSKLIRTLERAGMVERAPNPADTRAVVLKLTADGRRTVRAARAKVVELEQQRLQILGGRDGAESARLREALETLLRDAMPPTPPSR